MKPTKKSKPSVQKQVRLVIDGCNVKLNFAANSDEAVRISDVKKAILLGLQKQ